MGNKKSLAKHPSYFEWVGILGRGIAPPSCFNVFLPAFGARNRPECPSSFQKLFFLIPAGGYAITLFPKNPAGIAKV